MYLGRHRVRGLLGVARHFYEKVLRPAVAIGPRVSRFGQFRRHSVVHLGRWAWPNRPVDFTRGGNNDYDLSRPTLVGAVRGSFVPVEPLRGVVTFLTVRLRRQRLER
jgi:hypothetical protein